MRRLLGIEARTLYPPVVDPSPGLPWPERRTAFLAIGRFSLEKDYERVMRILARVQEGRSGTDAHHRRDHDRHTRRYCRELQRLAASLGSWIDFRQDLPRDEISGLMASHRYGIHGMREEHFGMAPAEMVRAGLIVWVPRGGGQVEIVGDEPSLIYETEEEAAERDPPRDQGSRRAGSVASPSGRTIVVVRNRSIRGTKCVRSSRNFSE